MPKYTPEEVATLVVMRSGGSSYKEINEVLAAKFGNDRKPETLSAKYNSIISSEDKNKVSQNLRVQTINSEKNWRSENATRRQLRTLAALTSPEATLGERMILADSFEQKGMTKGEASDLIQINMNKEKPKKPKSKKAETKKNNKQRPKKDERFVRKSSNYWTPAQTILLFQLFTSGKKWKQVAEILGRSETACIQKKAQMVRDGIWEDMQNAQAKVSLEEKEKPTEIEVFVEKHGNPRTRHITKDEKKMLLKIDEKLKNTIQNELDRKKEEESYETSWTHSQDMNILVNFYEMSIDEVREAFARPFWVVAQRLEMLFDSTEPEHIAMLMEASDIVLKRKSPRTEKPQKPSRKERRAAKKANKRAAKVARLEAKMERKLNRLRGE
tara:strand:+ start:787 stop:1941 length:1155 start_codon:yes stop_codon:yes gene_type:complete